jgi:hypothetical protein
MHFCTRSWRNTDRNWTGEEKTERKKGARDGDMGGKNISLAFQLAFSTSNVKLRYTNINQFPIRRVSPYS